MGEEPLHREPLLGPHHTACRSNRFHMRHIVNQAQLQITHSRLNCAAGMQGSYLQNMDCNVTEVSSYRGI